VNEYQDELCEVRSGGGAFGEALLAKESFPKGLGLVLLSAFIGTVAGVKSEVHCGGGGLEWQPVSATLVEKDVITFTQCSVLKPAKCEISSVGAPAGTVITDGIVGQLLSLKLVNFSPESGKTFVEVEFKNKAPENCALNGTMLEFEGVQSCDFEASASLPAKEHVMLCKKTGSLIKFGAERLTGEGNVDIHLEGSPYWKIH
jgi:hypothetical protein